MQKNHPQMNTNKLDTRRLATMGMLSALALVLVFLIRLPLIPAAPFLEYDPADIPILVGTLVFGPVAGLIMTIVVSAIQAMLLSAQSGIIGFIMHVTATGAMCIVVGLISHGRISLVSALLALLAGIATMTVVMVGMNLLLTPIFMGQELEAVIAMLVPAIIPFNLIKAGINSLGAFLVYRQVEKIGSRKLS